MGKMDHNDEIDVKQNVIMKCNIYNLKQVCFWLKGIDHLNAQFADGYGRLKSWSKYKIEQKPAQPLMIKTTTSEDEGKS